MPRTPYSRSLMASVYLVEDDAGIRGSVARAFSERGHAVRTGATALEALDDIINDPPDVVILDLGLPDIDGSDLLAMIRAVSSVPIIIATARDEESEVIRLLNRGADDHVVKPYSMDQLEARVRAVLRRVGGDDVASRVIEVGGLRIDLAARDVTVDGTQIDLTRREFDLLAHLASRAGEVVSKRELLAEVWHQPYGGADKTIDVHLSWLRNKLGESAAEPRYLHTIRGVGVKLVEPQ